MTRFLKYLCDFYHLKIRIGEYAVKHGITKAMQVFKVRFEIVQYWQKKV